MTPRTGATTVHLNLRSGPGTTFSILTLLPPSTRQQIQTVTSLRLWPLACGWRMETILERDHPPAADRKMRAQHGSMLPPPRR